MSGQQAINSFRLRGIAVLPAKGVLGAVLKYEVPDDETVAALPAEGVLVTVPAGQSNLSSLTDQGQIKNAETVRRVIGNLPDWFAMATAKWLVFFLA